MIFPAVTAFYAALFGLVLFGLSIWVIAARVRSNVLVGDGGDDVVKRRMRAHANFTEYVPLILILAGLFEALGGSLPTLRVNLSVLLVARIAHPFGMVAKENSIEQFACRGVPAILTLLCLLIFSVLLLIRLG
jgi:uncharacterized membrane protein YecN with MAPEG domain